MLRAGLNQLLNAARKGSDAGTYASLVIDNVPIEALNNFFLNASLDDLAKLNPEVNNFKPWFFELAEHIKANLGLDSTVSHLYESDDSDNVENNEEKPIDK